MSPMEISTTDPIDLIMPPDLLFSEDFVIPSMITTEEIVLAVGKIKRENQRFEQEESYNLTLPKLINTISLEFGVTLPVQTVLERIKKNRNSAELNNHRRKTLSKFYFVLSLVISFLVYCWLTSGQPL